MGLRYRCPRAGELQAPMGAASSADLPVRRAAMVGARVSGRRPSRWGRSGASVPP